MDTGRFIRQSPYEWWIPAQGSMRVPGIIYASEALLREMDDKVHSQIVNVTTLPGIVRACFAMPDAHWGYGFPIGGVAAFDPAADGVVCAGGVGFDISCGVRDLHTGLHESDIAPVKQALADALSAKIPAGVGSTGYVHLSPKQMTAMLTGGARWAVEHGYGIPADLSRIEENGCMIGADPDAVSEHAQRRQQDEVGTLGSGNHYLEVQRVSEIFAPEVAAGFGVRQGDILVSIHCGSRGLGHQIGTEFMQQMLLSAAQHGLTLPDRELACAPIGSPLGQTYLGAMRAAINCALANRQVLTQLCREVFHELLPHAELTLLFDVSHNTCKLEEHEVDGVRKALLVHRKGATRAFGPGHPDLPPALRPYGQPVLIGGSMGTASHILCGTATGMAAAFGSACHGAGRGMSRHEATRRFSGRGVMDELAKDRGIVIRSPSLRGVAEEAPGAYKDVDAVVEAAEQAGLARKVARLEPLICVKG